MSGPMFRTRFRQQIVAEFLPPSRERKTQRVVILCDGMPSTPRQQPLSEFLSGKGFWVIYPRYRRAWESGGHFLEKSPHEDILDITDDLPKDPDIWSPSTLYAARIRPQSVSFFTVNWLGLVVIVSHGMPRPLDRSP
jgi:hypothetical protein